MPLAMKCQINNGGYLQLRCFTFFCTTSLLRTILDPARWWLDKKFDSWSTAWKSTCGRWQYNFNSRTLASGKTRIAPKPSKTTTAWWLASNLRDVPTVPWNVKSTIRKANLPQHKPGSPGKTARHAYNFFALPTRSLLKTILDPASWWLPLLYRSGIKWAKWESRKQSFPTHGSPCENWSIPTTFQLRLFKATPSLFGTILWPSTQHTRNSFSGKMLSVEYSGGWTALRHHSALVEVLCCYWQSGVEGRPPSRHAGHTPATCLAETFLLLSQVICQLFDLGNSRSREEAALGINLHPGKHPNNRHQENHSNPHFGNETTWLHAPTMLPLMCGDLAWQKPLPLSTWAWLQSANCRLLFCS